MGTGENITYLATMGFFLIVAIYGIYLALLGDQFILGFALLFFAMAAAVVVAMGSAASDPYL